MNEMAAEILAWATDRFMPFRGIGPNYWLTSHAHPLWTKSQQDGRGLKKETRPPTCSPNAVRIAQPRIIIYLCHPERSTSDQRE